MKLEVGMYVRISHNFRKICLGIGQIKDIVQDTVYVNMSNNLPISFNLNDITKASHNIIDLIEDGDYINGFPVEDYFREYNEEKYIFENTGVITTECYLENTDFCWILERNIKTILTKEQFENNCYKIGDE